MMFWIGLGVVAAGLATNNFWIVLVGALVALFDRG